MARAGASALRRFISGGCGWRGGGGDWKHGTLWRQSKGKANSNATVDKLQVTSDLLKGGLFFSRRGCVLVSGG